MKKSSLFRNISWIILFFSLTFTILSGAGALGKYIIYRNPYRTHYFVSNMAELDSTLSKALYELDSEGKVNEEYVESKIQSEKDVKKEQYDLDVKEVKSRSIEANSKEEYESILEGYLNDLKEIYENDINDLESRIRLDAKYTENDFEAISNDLGNLKFFIKDKETGKILTNTSIEDIEEFAVSTEGSDEYEFFIQSGIDQKNYPYMSENAYFLRDYIIDTSDEDTIKVYKADKNIMQYPGDYVYEAKTQSENVMRVVRSTAILCGVFVVLAIVSVVYLYKTRAIFNNDFALLNKVYGKMRLEISIILIIVAGIFIFEMIQSCISYYSYGQTNNILLISGNWYEIAMNSFIVSLIGVLIYLSIRNIREKKPEEKTLEYIKNHSLILSLGKWIKKSYLNITGKKFIVLNFIILMIWISLAIACFFQGYYYFNFALIGSVMIVMYVIAVMVYWIKVDKYITNIYTASSRIRQGNFHETIKEEGPAALRLTAENLNNIKDGLENAIDSATRNEQLKTELITNVSHDLKTPLTSIINYIDLLKDENASDEEKEKYIDIITKKSTRLKVLIEDLFEASKAASRTMELDMERADIVSLVRQTLGEFEEKISHSNLKFVVKLPEEKVYVNIDGKKTWRVLENLISNILKYSMDNTRVYVEVVSTEEDASVVMRNISAFEMDFTGEDILERFKRGDGSRHTEGSGLGLSIAKSLTELQNGKFNIDIDGDLFKVTVTFKKYLGDIKAK